MKYQIVSIDAWREPFGGWTWNQSFDTGQRLEIEPDRATPRRVCRALREMGLLSDHSRGRVRVDDVNGMAEIIEIQNKATGEPVFALMAMESE